VGPRSARASFLLSGLLFAGAGIGLKFIQHVPLAHVGLVRGLVACSLSLLGLRYAKVRGWGKNKPLLILRGFLGTFSFLLFYYSMFHLPFATAVTIQYMAPIFQVLLAGWFFKEYANKYQWGALGLSLAGLLLLKGFETGLSGVGLLIGLTSALLSAIAYNLVRGLRGKDHPLLITFYFPLISISLLAPAAPFFESTAQGFDWGILLLVGLLTHGAQYYMTVAYQGETAANLAPLGYLALIYASTAGYFIFGEKLNPGSYLGMALIAVGSWAAVARRPR